MSEMMPGATEHKTIQPAHGPDPGPCSQKAHSGGNLASCEDFLGRRMN